MPTLIKSTLILAFARITNFALLFFSPVLLVRILDQASFGQYREFVAWATIATSIAAFSISSNLLYFVPRHPENTRRYVSHSNWLSLAMSILACAMLWLFADRIRESSSFDFVLPLALYVLLFVNVSFLDYYWVATRQPKYIFYYSTGRTIVRLAAVLGTAWVTRSVEAILFALIAVEGLRVLVVLVISGASRLLTFGIDRRLLADQVWFILPLGLGTTLSYIHQYIGQVVISAKLGVVALAIYAVASYNVPIVRIVRASIGESIFPDMVREAAGDQGDRLRLWKHATVAYSFLILPAFMLLFWYADVLIPLVFTEQYAAAVPIFRVLLLIMPLETIELNSPLRAAKRTPDMLAGNVFLLGTNLVCIFIFFRWFREIAIFGPAVGVVAGYVVQFAFLAGRVSHWYGVGFGDLMKWRSLGTVWFCALAGGLVLLAGEHLPMPPLWRIACCALLYALVYFLLIRQFRLEEVERVVNRVRAHLPRARTA